jgi:crossover junction endodeoxyribonuclease RusA
MAKLSKSDELISKSGMTQDQIDFFINGGLTKLQIANCIKKYMKKNSLPDKDGVYKFIKKGMNAKIKSNDAREWLKQRLGSATAEIPVYTLPPCTSANLNAPGQKLVLKFPVPMSVNHMYQTNFATGQKMMTMEAKVMQIQMQDLAKWEVIAQGWDPVYSTKVVAEITAYYKDNRSRDTDNLFKMLGDAFKGIVLDDDDYLLPRVIDWDVDKDDPRVEVILYVK